jgi:hypothetical protein
LVSRIETRHPFAEFVTEIFGELDAVLGDAVKRGVGRFVP